MATTEQLPDAPTGAPRVYRGIFANERVRVHATRSPGCHADIQHPHPPCSAYWITSGSLRVSIPAGQTGVEDRAVAHAGMNTGDTEIHALMVEFT